MKAIHTRGAQPVEIYKMDIHDFIDEAKFKEWVESFGDKFTDHFKLDYDPFEIILLCEGGEIDGVCSDDVIIRRIKPRQDSYEYIAINKEIFEKLYTLI